MTLEQLKEKYNYDNIPKELKQLKRWVCFKVIQDEKGKSTKRPYNALTGNFAKVNDGLTWTSFDMALRGCVKYNFDGIGFVFTNGYFGIDIDNHPDENGVLPMNDEEFNELVKEFIDALDSYAETSQSGLGVHIICQGKLPEGSRRKKNSNVEMYDTGRFFAFTGNVIHNVSINFREEEVKPLWEKYVNTEIEFNNNNNNNNQFNRNLYNKEVLSLTDEEIIDTAINSRNGGDFYKYYHDGDISMNGNDQSSADMSFCNMLAFWCNNNKEQMDRIFRNSALMRDKWDEKRGQKTYGEMTIDNACSKVSTGYIKTKSVVIQQHTISKNNVYEPEMNIDKNGEPIFRIKKIYKKYPYDDTGNALKFYDYFGDLFKYNVTDKKYMFWTGKTWIYDNTKIHRKYANKFIEILKQEEKELSDSIQEKTLQGNILEVNRLTEILKACKKNTVRVSNKAGKDAMLSEFEALYDVPVENKVFNTDDYLLNTDSGIVDLKTGKIMDFDKTKMMSKNTNIKVSFEEPVEWIKFLRSVFNNGDEEETQKLIDSLQTCLGYTLSGSTKEQTMFLLYGLGSNGKSTLTEQVAHILGDYGDNIASKTLMQQKAVNQSDQFSFAKLQAIRFVETGETDDGGKLAEAQLKILTGGDTISAQFKYGNEFSYKPRFKIWMSTNNRPLIRGEDYGIWRRIFFFPFLNSFTGDKKDKHLPDKLKAESEKILGWCIKGFLKYQETGLIVTKTTEEARAKYKVDLDAVLRFIERKCVLSKLSHIDCEELFLEYRNWAILHDEPRHKESEFREKLKKKGIIISKDSYGKECYYGIRLAGVQIGNG